MKHGKCIGNKQWLSKLCLPCVEWWLGGWWVGGWEFLWLVETATFEIIGNDDIGDGVEDKLNIASVRRARHVTIDLLIRGLVLRLELRLDVRRCLVVILPPCNLIYNVLTLNNEFGTLVYCIAQLFLQIVWV